MPTSWNPVTGDLAYYNQQTFDLFDGRYTLDLRGHQREDVSADGRRFLMVENSDDFPVVIVQNWAAELARTVR